MGECLILKSGGGTDTSDATATKEVILTGYTAYVNDEKLVGEMTGHDTVSESLNTGGSYSLTEGYYPKGTITANSLASQTDGNAAAAQILTGYAVWVKGSKINGSMANKGTVNHSLAASTTYTIPAGWHKGDGKVTQSLTTQPAKSVKPSTGNIIACAASVWTTGAVTIDGANTLKAENIKNGVTIFGVKGTFTGWVDSNITLVGNGNMDRLTLCEADTNSSIANRQPSAPYTNANAIQVDFPYFYDYSSQSQTPTNTTTWGWVHFQFSPKGMDTSKTKLEISSHIALYTPLSVGTDSGGGIYVALASNVTNVTRTKISTGATSSTTLSASSSNTSCANASFDLTNTLTLSNTTYKWSFTDNSVGNIWYRIYPWGMNGADRSWTSWNNWIRISNVVINRS